MLTQMDLFFLSVSCHLERDATHRLSEQPYFSLCAFLSIKQPPTHKHTQTHTHCTHTLYFFLIRLTYNGTDTSAKINKEINKIIIIKKNQQQTPEQNKWDCHLIAPNYHFDKWRNIKAGKQMTPRAPPAPLSLKKKKRNIAVIIHHQKHNREKVEGGGGEDGVGRGRGR